MRVAVANSERGFEVGTGESVLDAALAASWNLPHGCKGGNCGACRARLLSGEIHYPHGAPLGLSQAEAGAGFVLLCQARALSDLHIELRELKAADEAVVKRLPCRIEHALPLAHDVMGLSLRLPAVETFRFEPGQYIDIVLAGGRRRSFSIASPPHDSRLLEVHVRRVAGGEFSERLFRGEARGTLLDIEGPLGRFYYRPAAQPALPVLLIGGGTGIAPLLSILRHVVETDIQRDINLYWGVRAERDLYAQGALRGLLQRAPRLHYTPVLSEPDAHWRGRRGFVHAAVLEDAAAGCLDELARFEVYAAGPPAMIAAVRREFTDKGVQPDRLYFDSFDYAEDVPERHRSKADTRS